MAGKFRGTRVKGFQSDKVPPEGSVIVGYTPRNEPIFHLSIPRTTSQVKKDPKTGEDMYRRHITTGEPLYRIREPAPWPGPTGKWERTFILIDGRNGNVELQDYHIPTEVDKAAAQRRLQIQQLQDALPAFMVDHGITPANLIDRLLGMVDQPQATAPAPSAPPAPPATEDEPPQTESGPATAEAEVEKEDAVQYPEMYAPGRWRFSNGETFQGTKVAAEELESKITDQEREAYQQRLQELEEAEAEAKENAEATAAY